MADDFRPNLDMIERRFVSHEVRAFQDGEHPVLSGTGAVFNSESEDLGGFFEIIEPGFFDDVLSHDVRCLWNHNADIPLGRTANDTLRLMQDSVGLHYENEINPEDAEALSKYAKVRRGDVTQSSFAFSVKRRELGDEMDGDEWKVAGTKIVRILKRGGCRELFDVSPVTYPGYQKASVQARSMAERMARELAGDDDLDSQAAGGSSVGDAQVQAHLDAELRELDLRQRRFRGTD